MIFAEMLQKISLILSMMSLEWVDGFQPDLHELFSATRTTTTDLMETFVIGENPSSYISTSSYEDTTPQPKARILKYSISNSPTYRPPIIQYAPLKPSFKTKKPSKAKEPNLKKAENKKKTNHLEPRFENLDHMEVHKNHYRSFVPGHNVEVLPLVRKHNNSPNALYQNFHEYLQAQKVNIPKHTSQDLPKRSHFEIRNFKKESVEKTSDSIKNINQIRKKNPGHSFTSHTEPNEEYQQVLRSKVPRLHLNIARVYGIAHLPHKASELINTKENESRSPIQIRGILKPQSKPSRYDKTQLFPVDFRKFFPL